jgi:aminopeptidase YwaD
LWLLGLIGCAHDEPGPPEVLTAAELSRATATLTDLGPRLVGTAGEDEAAAAVERELRDAGVDVETWGFSWDAWNPGEAHVRAGDRVFDAEPLSPSPPTSDLTAVLAPGDDVAGAIALRRSHDGSRAEEFVDAATGGAVALIRVTDDVDDDGSPLIEVGHTLAGATLPCVAVDRPTGDALEDLAGEPVTIDIATTVLHDHPSVDVIGRVAGLDAFPVVVTAHYDSWHPSESAFDDALGVGMLEVLAERLAQGPPPQHDVIFLATSGEEQGLQGAFHWTAAFPDVAAAASLVIELDIPWASEGQFFVSATDEDQRTSALEAAAAEGLDAIDGGEPGIASDHFAFAAKGAPTMWNQRWPDRRYHTRGDRIGNLDFDEAAAVLRMHWRILAEAAGVPETVDGAD